MALRDLIPWNRRSDIPVVPHGPENETFRQLQTRMNRIFDEFTNDWPFAPTGPLGSARFEPSLDMEENDERITIRAELPGLTEDDLDVRLTDGSLTLQGEKKQETREGEGEESYRESAYGFFRRQIPLPCEVQADAVDAHFANGVLKVTLPKSEEAKAKSKRIEVNAS